MGKFLIEDVNAKGLLIWMNDNFRVTAQTWVCSSAQYMGEENRFHFKTQPFSAMETIMGILLPYLDKHFIKPVFLFLQ
jgi:hypothetical protein